MMKLKKMMTISLVLFIVFSVAACGNNKLKDKTDMQNSEKESSMQTINDDSSVNSAEDSTDSVTSMFPNFTAKGLDGKKYSQEIFKENDYTLVNFWFTGCHACLEEMPYMEEISQDFKKEKVGMMTVCADANDPAIAEEAKKIIEKNGLTFPNLVMNSGDEINEFMNNIMAFPTTLVVDKDYNIIGEPLLGTIAIKEQLDVLKKYIEDDRAAKIK